MSERRLIMPATKAQVTSIDRIATVDGMISDLNFILKDQIEKQRIKAVQGTLTVQELKVIEGLADSVVKLSREERERGKNDDILETLKALSDEELLKLIKR